ncbi:MAG: hypothetical protein CL820_01625 [Croceicoccus sp.]|nr:hypothetical protein [Croceicoccus sp.]MAL24588.1 hypothetical protein [Croceicoccus sp.]
MPIMVRLTAGRLGAACSLTLVFVLASCSTADADSMATNASVLVPSAQSTMAPAAECNVSAIQAMAPADTTIVSAEAIVEPVAHCRVEGYVTTNDPGPNEVNFRLQLPDKDWAGRFYFIGLGGSAGYVPTDSQVPAGNPLNMGFAVAGTDTGRQGSMLDWRFMGEDPAKAMDHVHRGGHVVTVATQQITKQYYDVDSMYRYHSGCSGGGRMGMMAIDRHPEDYDGVLIGAPGGRSSATQLKFLYNTRQMIREPGAWLSPAKLQMAEGHVLKACDALDGAKDQMINDHRMCSFDFQTIACKAGDGEDCLTQPEIRSIEAVLEGPSSPKGKLTEGFPISNLSVWSGFLGASPPPWSPEPSPDNMQKGSPGYVIVDTLARAYFGQEYDVLKDFDLSRQKDIDAWFAAAKRLDFGYPYNTDLRPFQRDGGKVLFWNGVSDPCCSDIETEQYFLEAGNKADGGMAGFRDMAAYYRIPGMAHCGGGTGPADAPDQLLRELIDWVEKGKAPGPVVAHRGTDRAKMAFADQSGTVSGVIVPPPTGSSRDFLLCPYPTVATFKGVQTSDGVYDAANWQCQKR